MCACMCIYGCMRVFVCLCASNACVMFEKVHDLNFMLVRMSSEGKIIGQRENVGIYSVN